MEIEYSTQSKAPSAGRERGFGNVSPQGLEPWTPSLKVRCSSQLS